MADKPIKTPSGESEKNKSSDSKVLYLIKPTDEAEDLLDAIYGRTRRMRTRQKPKIEHKLISTQINLGQAYRLVGLKTQEISFARCGVAVWVRIRPGFTQQE